MICLIFFPTQHSAVIFLSKGEEDDKVSFLNCTQGWREEMMAVTRQKEMSVTWQAFVASAEICRTTNGTNKRKNEKNTNFIIFLFGRKAQFRLFCTILRKILVNEYFRCSTLLPRGGGEGSCPQTLQNYAISPSAHREDDNFTGVNYATESFFQCCGSVMIYS